MNIYRSKYHCVSYYLLRCVTALLYLFAMHTSAESIRWDASPVIPDVSVVNQDGERTRFYSDLVKDKTVAINFIFTNCTAACPVLSAVFRETQLILTDQIARNIHFISISIDPANDRSENLKQYAAKFDAGAGWTFVTGNKSEIDRLVKALGVYAGNKFDHSPVVMIGNDKASRWTRVYGFSGEKTLVRIIKEASVMEKAATNPNGNEASLRTCC